MHNLPSHATPFLGRNRTIRHIVDAIIISQSRLITLTGMGGIGKTRLSMAVGQHLSANKNHFEAIYFVPLAPLHSSKQIGQAIASAIGITLNTNQPEQSLIQEIESRQILLILDNFEHLLDGRTQITSLIENCPNLYILVTSRERLNITDELIVAVRSMTLNDDNITVDNATHYSAIQLFLNIAQKVDWNFQITPENIQQVIAICQRVEGVHLAIELAAALVRLMSPQGILDHLKHTFGILDTTLPHLPERHRSIRAVFESSWQLLQPQEQIIYAQLSVFRGGFTREAAHQIMEATPSNILSFIDKSLLYHDQQDRYTLHELLRQYAEEKLENYPQYQASIRERHAVYYSHFLVEREPVFKTDGRLTTDTTHEITSQLDNVRLMWTYAIQNQRFDIVDESVETLYHFHRIRGSYREMSNLLEDALTALQVHATHPIYIYVSSSKRYRH